MLQLELFTDRLPKRPYCKDEKDAPNLIRLSRHAIRRRYIQINPPNLRFWMPFDIDREGAALAWEDADLPPPNWAATNPANGHAHVAWALSAPVLSGDGSRDAPLRYLCGIEYAYREKMQADHGFNGLIVKNPAHTHWRTLWGPAVTYELSELAEYVDLPKFIPKRKPEEIGLGRNCSVFDWLRLWAYKAIRQHWAKETRNFIVWQAKCYDRALERNGELLHPLDYREVWHIAASVARFCWKELTPEGFSQWQAAQGRKGGKASGVARAAANEDKRASARLMAAQGIPVKDIAEEIGTSLASVYRWISDSHEAISGNSPN